jgi:hypothetical protein
MSQYSVKVLTLFFCVFACILPSIAQSASTPHTIKWDRQTFSIDGKSVVLIGGSVHYFRIPPAEWAAGFERMREDGFNVVDIYIPWFIHEPEEDKFDFESLEKFLDLAHKFGLYVVARPGPYINSETDQGGFPRWLSGKGVGFRRNSDLDRKWSKHWYDAVMPILARNQITRGGPVIMVQLENEYGHPQYIDKEEKKAYVRFLYETTSAYGFDVPLMGNDMQFAQEDPADPILSKIYGAVDAYFDSYKDLEKMLTDQRKLNLNTPLGCAEYGLENAEPTVTTMLGLGAGYLDQYLFAGGSQFAYAAKGYESSGYDPDAIIAEGGYALPNYGGMKAAALFLRRFGAIESRAEPAAEPATVDDPEVWIKQRNNGGQGFLFVRSDMRGVSELTLALKSVSQQHISYHDPRSGEVRSIPQYSTLLLRRNQTRLMPLDFPINHEATLEYSTADLLGMYADPDRTWLVLYGNTGEVSEAAIAFATRPSDLGPEALWNEQNHQAVFRLPFGDRDQIVPVAKDISLLLLSRQRAYRAKEFSVANEPVLVVSPADETLLDQTGRETVLHLQARHSMGDFTVLAGRPIVNAKSENKRLRVERNSGAQQFSVDIAVPALTVPNIPVRIAKNWTGFAPSLEKTVDELVSLPEAGIWKKGITHYHAGFTGRGAGLRLRFFTDDFKAVYIDGQFISEASNRAREAFLRPYYCAVQKPCTADIYYVDTGRPKEDLGLWRLDERKGLASADWIEGSTETPLHAEWQLEFAGLDDIGQAGAASRGLTAVEYSFRRPSPGELTAIWRAFMPDVPGLVYLNGTYMEHHQPGQPPVLGRPGIYLPPSMLKDDNKLLFVALEPIPPNLELPLIRPEADSIRKESTVILKFAASASGR